MFEMIRNLFTGPAEPAPVVLKESRSIPVADLFAASSYNGELIAGIFNEQTALTYAPLWQAVKLISGDISKLPFEVFEMTGDDETSRRPAVDLNVYDVVRWQPDRLFGAVKWWRRFMVQGLIWSNAYARIVRGMDGEPIALKLLESAFVTHAHTVDGQFAFWYHGGSLGWQAIDPADVYHVEDIALHIDDERSIGQYTPLQLIQSARITIMLGLCIERYGKRFFESGGRMGGLLELPHDMDEEAKENLEVQFRSVYNDLEAAFRTVVLRDGAKFHEGQFQPDQTQMIESRQQQLVDVAGYFNIPTHKLGVADKVAFNSLEQENQSYADSCLTPWTSAISDEAQLKLLTQRQRLGRRYRFQHDMSKLLQPDLKTRYEIGQIGVQSKLHTPNEWREKYTNWNPMDGDGDESYIPLNMDVKTVSQGGGRQEPAAQPATPEPTTNGGDDDSQQNGEDRGDNLPALWSASLRIGLDRIGENYRKEGGGPIWFTHLENRASQFRKDIHAGSIVMGERFNVEPKDLREDTWTIVRNHFTQSRQVDENNTMLANQLSQRAFECLK